MPNELASRLEPVVAEAVTAAGFDLDALDVQPAGRRKLVKVVVDSDDGVGLDEVAEVSRVLSGVLDEHEHLIAGAYTLEVTSPGVDRPLTAPRHWRRARFRQVRVTPTEGADFTGRVGDAGETAARMLVGGTIRDVRYADVAKAVLEVEFKQPPADELKKLEQDARHAESAPAAESTSKDNSEGAASPSAAPKEEPR
ncbi:ribosome maturation factor RimP [Saccharomonospora sp. CUA-673]|uniref:ribosome maturation factor RimP n=1 Tax=Saccharomonospora sp. CUA-673 TaxID=1904969 RepID=UPI0009598916|nr:ribosome maturation factor RimP [Saccharomonospora sp. CUA-673]OLT38486.1 ribosome maturation factor RimP [Saccharomonospora sp. CUA-673]